MKTSRLLYMILIFLVPSLSSAQDIALPLDLSAQVSIVRADRHGFWEKTLVVRFPQRRRVISTNDGLVDAMAAVNHAAHSELWSRVDEGMKTDHEAAGRSYIRVIRERTARQFGLRSEDLAFTGTAADMDNMAVVTKTYQPFVVTALVTAGARGNALRAGLDEGTYIEPDPSAETRSPAREPAPGTINVVLLCNARITDGGLARAIITVTEAKTAALEDLNVPSTYTKDAQATGTGTDSVIVVSGTSGPLVTYPGGHSRIGDLIGKAVYEAVAEALEKQNGFRKKLFP